MGEKLLSAVLKIWNFLSSALSLKAFFNQHRGCLSKGKHGTLSIAMRNDVKLSRLKDSQKLLIPRVKGKPNLLSFLFIDKYQSELSLDWTLFFLCFPPQKPIFDYFLNDKTDSYWQLSVLSWTIDMEKFFFLCFSCFSCKSDINTPQDTVNTTRLKSIYLCIYYFYFFELW